MSSSQPRKIVDLSLDLKSNMMVYPGDPEVTIEAALTVAKDGVNVLSVHMGSQTGTHLDSPFHINDAWQKLDELPMTRFLGPVIVVEALGLEERAEIPWSTFAPYLSDFKEGTLVLLRTDWSDLFFGEQKYLAHPYPSLEATTNLVKLGVKTIGLDILSLDRTPKDGEPFELPNHKVFLDPDGVIVENMTNLKGIDESGAWMSAFPMKLGASDGGPVRAVAFWR